jgi:thermitase
LIPFKQQITMLKSTLIFCFLILTGFAISQNLEPVYRVIIKIKREAYSPGFSFCNKGNVGNKKIEKINKKFNALQVKKLVVGKKSEDKIFVIEFPNGTNIDQIIEEYIKTGDIEYAEPDYRGSGGGVPEITPNDSYYFRQWSLKNTGTFALSPSVAGADIKMERAWDIEEGDSSIIVAIIDSGVKLNHPEFIGRIWTNYNEISNNGIDDDNDGYIDDNKGWDFANNDNNPMDDYGHGTNVAGIIGANGNNATGYAGIDWHCKLMILKGLDNTNSGYYSWWIEAIYYAADHGARVINMSLGGSSYAVSFENAVEYAIANGVVVVVSMGNGNTNKVSYPAGFSGVIAVGSTNSNDRRTNPFFWSATSGSNFGSNISVVAPGNYIYGLDYQSNSDYSYYWGGTSQAAPHVTGLAALLLAQNPNRTPAQIKSIIEKTAEDQVGDPFEDTAGWDPYYGFGRINAYKALSFITSASNSSTAKPEISIIPNPTSGSFKINSNSYPILVKIFNPLGQLECSLNIHSPDYEIQEKLFPGVYLLKFESNERSTSEKLIVQ